MSGVEQLRHSQLARFNPAAKLGAATVIALGMILTTNLVTSIVALVLLVITGIALRLPIAACLRSSAVALLAAPLGALTTLLYAPAGGDTFFSWGIITVSSYSVQSAIAVALRILVIAVPSIILFASIDPSDLATAVALQLHASTRFVLGALAALRMLGSMTEDWRNLSFARRARRQRSNPLTAIPRFVQQTFSLLALSLRRGEVLAVAMEARGLDSGVPRSYLHPTTWSPRDSWFVAVASVIVAVSIVAAVSSGNWTWAVG